MALGVCLIVGGALAAAPVRAQGPLSLGAYVGVGNTSGGNFSDRVKWTYGADLDVRVAQIGSTRFVVGTEAAKLGGEGDYVTVVNPGGISLTGTFPNVTYLVATAGVRHYFTSGESLEIGAGYGSVKEERGPTYPGLWWTAGVSKRFTDALSLVIGIRSIQWTHAGNTLHAYPITF
ncbi:MAG: hypothetical protein KGO03_11360, partial [Gemmatimonadota bacterium]|nr:hypothetical protein [Gemmatimonadota bacterium]